MPTGIRMTLAGAVVLLSTTGFAVGQGLEETALALNRYCVTCHNSTLRTAGLVIDPDAAAEVGNDAETWEKLVRKLRSRDMPPAGAPRPEEATYEMLASFLEAELDRSAAANPDPGRLPLLHRLTRTEYRNAIRDLLALDDLPREMDYELLLPADNAASGFDNIADLLFTSPATMERYLDAARKISRLAVGDPAAPEMVNIHRLSPELPQDARMEGLPFGTRGGIAIPSYFPLDAEYVIDVETTGRARQPQQLEISVDGERVELATMAPAGGRGRSAPPTEFRVPVRAGRRLLGVTFLERTEALNEVTVRPQSRSRGPGTAIASVTIRGPFGVSGPGDTPSRRRIFVCAPEGVDEERPCAERILSNLVRRAFRRPPTDADLAALLEFYEAGRRERDFDYGIQKALERLLVSPQFLFQIEREPEGLAPGALYPITDLELASRLAFFLWSSIPDDPLLEVAVRGDLSDPDLLEQQVERMLADARAQSLVTNFAAQWLFLGDVSLKEPDVLIFRDFDQTLRRSFERETELFLSSVLFEGGSVLALLDADYTFVNERLAEHYGIPNVQGSDFRRVQLPEGSPRGGLLGQGSVLTLTSYSTRTSPVLRGKYVLDNLLASPPPPPPPDVPALTTEAETPGETLSIRDAMIRHRANPVCAACHARMDPIGFALENFDAVGRWRETDAGRGVDASGTLTDGTRFEGLSGLKQALMRRPQQFVGAMAEKLLMYALGRNIQYYDAPVLREIVRESESQGYTFESLVMGVVRSTPFRMRSALGAGESATGLARSLE